MTKTRLIVKLWKLILKVLRNPWIKTSESMKKNVKFETSAKENNEVNMEHEYMPQLWSSRFENPEAILHHHLHFITSESETVVNKIPHVLDVKYGSATHHKLDIFGTDLPDDAPILAIVPGGYWKQMSKDISRYPAVPLHGAGIKTFVIGYDTRHKVTLWDIVDQVENALCYTLRYAEDMGSRGVYFAGHCGGAHIISTVLANSELFDYGAIARLNGVFFISGIYDLRNICHTSVNTTNLAKIDAISMSPLYKNYTHLENSKIRLHVLAAQDDSPIFKKQSRDFYELLHDICPLSNMHFEIKENMDHFNIVECFALENNYLTKLILHDVRKHS